jgi:hypothetical protein
MLRRLEDRIRELCAKSITAGEDDLAIIADLKAALREHVERIRKVVARTNFATGLRLERRAKPSPLLEIELVSPQDAEKERKSG